MHILEPLRQRLGDCKHTGRWQKISDLSGVPYNTLARVYQGRIKNPSVVTVEKLYAAMNSLDMTEPVK